MKAANDFIIVKNTMMEEQTRESGLVIKRANKDAENNGIIESIGESVTNKDLQVGTLVWFSSVECRVGEEERKLVAIREKNIIAIGE
jgi:co-chaperonin GroES (HSP10)